MDKKGWTILIIVLIIIIAGVIYFNNKANLSPRGLNNLKSTGLDCTCFPDLTAWDCGEGYYEVPINIQDCSKTDKSCGLCSYQHGCRAEDPGAEPQTFTQAGSSGVSCTITGTNDLPA